MFAIFSIIASVVLAQSSTSSVDVATSSTVDVTVTTAVPSAPTNTVGPKFNDCPAGTSKYFSEVKQCAFLSNTNCQFNCGVTCLTPGQFSLDKVFESGLTLATNNSPCAAYPKFTGTESHAWVSLDMFNDPSRTN